MCASTGEMKKSELTEFRRLLESLLVRLGGDVKQMTKAALGSDRQDAGGESKSPTHMAEVGSDTYEQDFSLSMVVNQQKTLSEITLALQKIKDGTYGQCEGCVKEGKTPAKSAIPKARLREIPWTRNCVNCERNREQFT